MPRAGGSGGGSRGGGSRGGGSRGGGSHGGGHHGHHSHHGGHHGRNGVYVSPFFFLLPLMVIVSMVSMLMASVPDVLDTLRYGGVVTYDEQAIRGYAEARYREEFSDSPTYEDHLLLVFLTAKDHKDFAYIAWAGNHIDERITMMLGNNSSALGKALESEISVDSYEKTLGGELAEAIRTLERRIEAKALDTSFTCKEAPSSMLSHCVDDSELALDTDTLDEALLSFGETTGITFVVTVDDMTDVFKTEIPWVSIAIFLGGTLLIGVLVCMTVSIMKNRKKINENGNDW